MKKVNIFIIWASFYIAWIFINNFFQNIYYSIIVLSILGLFFGFLLFKRKEIIKFFIIFLVFFLFWIFISELNLYKIKENFNFLENFNWKVEIISKIDSIKELKNWNIIYKGKILKINEKTPKNTFYNEIIIKDKYERLKKWEIIKNFSKMYLYKNSEKFSYKNYMLTNWYYFKNYANSYKKIWFEKPFKIEEILINFRENILSIIKNNYPEREAIFLWWILIWAREELPEELKQNFNNSWLTHFIAVSWFNITILILFFWIFIKFLPNFAKIWTMSIIIFLFVMLVWPTPPVVRAWIMWFIWFLVLQKWRNWNILSIALLTLILMISFNPLSINYDVSLHLSFLAVFWIIYTEKFFNKLFSFLPNIFEIRTAVSITFAALSFTLPIMMFGFWQVSIIAPLTNLLVSWSIPIAMLFWFISIIFFYFFEQFWFIFWYFTYLFLRWNIEIVNFFWSLNFSVIKTDFWEYSWYYQIIYLIILTFLIIYLNKKD